MNNMRNIYFADSIDKSVSQLKFSIVGAHITIITYFHPTHTLSQQFFHPGKVW